MLASPTRVPDFNTLDKQLGKSGQVCCRPVAGLRCLRGTRVCLCKTQYRSLALQPPHQEDNGLQPMCNNSAANCKRSPEDAMIPAELVRLHLPRVAAATEKKQFNQVQYSLATRNNSLCNNSTSDCEEPTTK